MRVINDVSRWLLKYFKQMDKSLPDIDDFLGQAARQYFLTGKNMNLRVNNTYGQPEQYPIDVFFRDYHEMPLIEHIALSQCYGEILDVGAGAGCHALYLQGLSQRITTLESSLNFVNIQQQRGIRQIIHDNIMNVKHGQYDTLFFMMNGIGLAQNITGLIQLLNHLKGILNSNGQILLDSTDISYLWDEINEDGDYFGEVEFQFAYRKSSGNWFKWLYIDKGKLQEIAENTGWQMEVIHEEDTGRYLAKLIQ